MKCNDPLSHGTKFIPAVNLSKHMGGGIEKVPPALCELHETALR